MANAKKNGEALSKSSASNLNSSKFSITKEAQAGLLKEPINLLIFFICFFLLLVQSVLIIFFWKKIPPQIPFYYSKPWGESMLASPFQLWLLPVITFIFDLFNFIVATIVFNSEKFLARILVIASGLISFVSVYAIFKIITLVT